jgi:hypothetical protein
MAIPLQSFYYPFPGNGFQHRSHCNFKSHAKSSWHGLIPSFSFLQLPIPKRPKLLPTTAAYSAVCRCIPILLTLLFLQTGCLIQMRHGLQKTPFTCQNAWRGPHRKHRFLYCCEGMFTAPLPRNRSPTVACTCCGNAFTKRCLAMGIHVTICSERKEGD